MFDEHAKQLLDRLPKLGDLDPTACRRALSTAYAFVVERRLKVVEGENHAETLLGIRLGLRRMADALESVAIFDPLYGVEIANDVIEASAFAAAEAMAVLALMPTAATEQDPTKRADAIQDSANYCRIESALLYLVSGYDINAVAVVKGLPDFVPTEDATLEECVRSNAAYLLSRLRALCMGDVRDPQYQVPFTGYDEPPELLESVLLESRLRAYELLATGTNTYLDWLAGRKPDGRTTARAAFTQVQRASIPENHPDFVALADLHHLSSLLIAALDRTSQRSVVHSIPPPRGTTATLTKKFIAYLRSRAQGSVAYPGRPFVWPSAQEFVRNCLPGPKADAVVAMPTGSGKSFVAELAIADALTRGSVIYLAPTNALVHQIRRDLEEALASFADVEILAFLGSGEYSGRFEDLLGDDNSPRFVAVMTPEKCALALRLSRKSFANLALCVFDECHLLNDDSRGVTMDILLAQLFVAAPQMNFVLMSAMVSNPDDLAGWLREARKSKALPSITKWRPSRTLRGLLAIDGMTLKQRATTALAKLRERQKTNKKRKNETFIADLAVVAGLSGPWTNDGPADYRVAHLPVSIPAYVFVDNGKPRFDVESWKNTAARLFAESLARADIPAIAFILSSRHHVFSLANEVGESMPGSLPEGEDLPLLVEAWLNVAETELGVESALRALLRKGVAVHTSAMLQPEQAAAEWMFKKEKVKLMLATPTLAQGLNLPAIGVVIAGTSMGGSNAPDADNLPGMTKRIDATILNSFGRAGRPGFSNQGIAVLVPDKPSKVEKLFDPMRILEDYSVLGRPDAAVEVHSPIEHYLDRALMSPQSHLAISDVEWELTTLLAESTDADDAGQILRRTFAGYRKRAEFTAAAAALVRDRIEQLKQDFLLQEAIPAWLNVAAAQAGIGVFRAQRLWQAYSKRGLVASEDAKGLTLVQWFTILIETLREMPPRRIGAYMADDAQGPQKKKPDRATKGGRKARVTPLTKLRDLAVMDRDTDSIPWNVPDGWDDCWTEIWKLVCAYMRGETFVEIASRYLGDAKEEIEPERGTGKAIPAVFAFIRKVVEALARDAGCFVALNEHAFKTADEEFKLPETLQALPLCIRFGCRSLDVLGWYRFGYRERVCAHALANAFPVPDTIVDEAGRTRWIAKTRRQWIKGELVVPPKYKSLLQAAQLIIQQRGD